MKIDLTSEEIFEIQCAVSRRIIQFEDQAMNHASEGMRSLCKIRALELISINSKLETQLRSEIYES